MRRRDAENLAYALNTKPDRMVNFKANLPTIFQMVKDGGLQAKAAEALIKHPQYIDKLSRELIINIFQDPKLVAEALLSSYTDPELTRKLVVANQINFIPYAPFTAQTEGHPVLREMLNLLQAGAAWENTASSDLMLVRAVQDPKDYFIQEVSKYDLNYSFASALLNIYPKGTVRKNLSENQNNDVATAVSLKEILANPSSFFKDESKLPSLMNILNNQYQQELGNEINNILMNQSKDVIEFVLNQPIQNNLPILLTRKDPNNLDLLLGFIKTNIDEVKRWPGVEQLLHVGFETDKGQSIIFSRLSQEELEKFRMYPNDRKMVDEHFAPQVEEQVEEYNPYLDLLSFNKNWYKTATLEKDAGRKENLIGAILMGLVAIMGGSTVQSALARAKEQDPGVTSELLMNALQDPRWTAAAENNLSSRTGQPPPVEPVKRNMPYNPVSPNAPQAPGQTSPIQMPKQTLEQIVGKNLPDKEWVGVVVHHSASDPRTTTVEKIDQWHKEKGWDGIGYHFFIDGEGVVHAGRPLGKQGAHALTGGERDPMTGEVVSRNPSHVGICLAGYDKFSAAQLQSLGRLISDLSGRYNIQSVERHHENCPGAGVNVEVLNQTIQEKRQSENQKNQVALK